MLASSHEERKRGEENIRIHTNTYVCMYVRRETETGHFREEAASQGLVEGTKAATSDNRNRMNE